MQVTKKTNNIMQVYVSTYAKYSRGSLKGEWVQLDNFDNYDEFMEFIQELHKDEESPEFMYQDYEGINGSETEMPDVWAIIEELEDMPFKVYQEWASHYGYDMGEGIEECLNSYIGDYSEYDDPELEYAVQYINECCDLPEWVEFYFDYQAFARNLFFELQNFNGYIFNSH